jgi:O-antigen ligase
MAFPLFFLVIMTTASYLNVYGSGFLFSLFSAVLFKTQSNGQGAIASDPSTRIPG